MRKSMLIINTPDNCYSCRFREFNKDMLNDKNGGEYEAITGFKCFINNKELDSCAQKPDWCPLKELDKKIENILCRCYEMGLDESQAEVIVNELIS